MPKNFNQNEVCVMKKWNIDSAMRRIIDYLSVELASGPKYIDYVKIAEKTDVGLHSVRYSINKLRRMGRIEIVDHQLSLKETAQ